MATDLGTDERMTEIAALAAHPRNYNRHSAGQVADLARSLTRFGQRKPVVTWRGVILAGHGLVEAARSLGWSEIWTAEAPVEWTEAEALAFVAADNELARVADPDVDALAALVAELGDVDEELARLAAGGEEALKRLLASIAQPAGEDPGAQIDKAEELRAKWQVEPGQLWQLGEHRLICGDCTDAAVLARVMGGEKAGAVVTDPPYGMQLDTNYAVTHLVKGNSYAPVIGDDKEYNPGDLIDVSNYPHQFWFGADYYCWSLPRGGSWLVWDKKKDDLDASIGSGFELIWTWPATKREVIRVLWSGFTAKERDEARVHPTQKPVELIVNLVLRTSGIVVDFYSGSGTTLIACEKLGRRCRAVEISPAYVAVALERWATMTGQTPRLVDVAAAVHDAPDDDE